MATTLPIIRFSIQIPRRLNWARTLLTKYVMPNHHDRAPRMMAKVAQYGFADQSPVASKGKAGEQGL